MMKELLLFGFMFSLQSQAVVPQSIALSGMSVSELNTNIPLKYVFEGKPEYELYASGGYCVRVAYEGGLWDFFALQNTLPLYQDTQEDVTGMPPKTWPTQDGSTPAISYTYERSVIAHRPDLTPEPVVFTAEMPLNLWTNSVLWLTAESPVLNAGATSAQWLCYAKTCVGNAVQTTLNRQPLRVFTNGVWVYRFDGSDDYISIPSSNIIGGTNSFTIIGKITPQQGATRIICSQWDYANTNRKWQIQMNSGSLVFSSNQAGTPGDTLNSTVSSNLIPTSAFSFKFVRNGTSGSWQINGTNVASSGSVKATINSSNAQMLIGAQGTTTSPAGYYGGNIEYIQIFNGSL